MGQHCCICGRAIRPNYWVCCHCRRRYKLPERFAEWPEWAKALQVCEGEDRLYWKHEANQHGDMLMPCPPDDPDCLPTDPYEKDEDNLTYRRANKVTR